MVSRGAGGHAAAIPARAKVNLYLNVTGRGQDSYHTLDSLHVRTCLADRLWLSPAPEMALEVTGPFAESLLREEDAENLAMRAVAEVCRSSSSRQAFRVRLEKNIPVAAGLGGGSADAAAALRAVSAHLGCAPDLSQIAGRLGADIPSCLVDRPVLTAGRGDIVRPAPPLPHCAAVLVNPGHALLTRSVFENRTGPFSLARPIERPVESYDGLVRELETRHNDLEAAACRIEPAVREVLDALGAWPEVSIARMSGSGATCFGLTDSLEKARRVSAGLRRRHPHWWVEATELLTGSPASHPGDAHGFHP